ncbi:ATP synthase protein I [Methylovirgula sp. HY1]|jgi:ATP synthase protein I|nr:ATP synthase protein I [Methylovirgula sp. HY1]
MAQNVNDNERGRRSAIRDATDQEQAGGNKAGRKEASPDETSTFETREDAALKARLASLSSALDARQRDTTASESNAADLAGQSLGKAINLGLRVLTEFVAAIVVGAVIGWQLDTWFHTKPFLLILFLGLGTAAGFVNVYRLAASPTGPKRGTED